MYGGADVMVVPSRSEPCGLTQLYALRYGAVPLVRKTGGLADTVVDFTDASVAAGTATGFVFEEATAAALAGAIERACANFAQPETWSRLQRTGMTADFSWERAARDYVSVYDEL